MCIAHEQLLLRGRNHLFVVLHCLLITFMQFFSAPVIICPTAIAYHGTDLQRGTGTTI